MATYKLMQDIEAEDHILGPLSLRQFIFALIACFFGYLCFIVITQHIQFLLVLFAPPAIFFAFFAFPFGRDQPTEVWFLAKLRFWFLPRKRIWDQSGVKEMVTITVPKKIEQVLTDGLSQTEVKSRLHALAHTLDSRGWVVKNVDVYAPPVIAGAGNSERLLDLSSFPQDVPADTPPSDDMLDIASPIAKKVDAMVSQSVQEHHQKLIDRLNESEPAHPVPSNNWFMSPGAASAVPAKPAATPLPVANPVPAAAYVPPSPTLAPVVPAASTANENELAEELKRHADQQDLAYGHLRTMQPLGGQPNQPPVPAAASPTPVTTPSDPAILALASNDDLNVETLAREAHKARDEDHQQPDEVVISLR